MQILTRLRRVHVALFVCGLSSVGTLSCSTVRSDPFDPTTTAQATSRDASAVTDPLLDGSPASSVQVDSGESLPEVDAEVSLDAPDTSVPMPTEDASIAEPDATIVLPDDSADSAAADATDVEGARDSGSPFPLGVTTPRLMIVGDSVSAGPGCYKKYLNQNLHDNGITNYEFVGEYTDGCGGGIRHSAVSCSTAAHYTQESFTMSNCFQGTSFLGMAPLVEKHDPDLVMLQLGVNDVWSGNVSIQPILANYGKMVDQARAHNPNIVVVVAQIHKVITNNCPDGPINASAEQLVMAVPDWAQSVSTEQSPVLVADLWTNSDPSEADDCVHPNDAGAQNMGLNWYNALKDLLR